jgi:hypothetical protein
MGAVDHGEDAGLPGAAANLLDREDQGAERGDMREVDDLRALGDLCPERIDDLLMR